MLLVKLLIVACLAMIFWEDLRSRMVHWFWFPLLVTGFVVLRFFQGESLRAMTSSISVSMGFIAVQLLLVSLYFSFKSKRWINITDGMLGWGDVLLLVSLAFYFALPALVAFYISSLLIILVGWLIYQRIWQHPAKLIPLAGLQAIALLLLVTIQWTRPDWAMFDWNNFLGGLL